jgi:hypothetical protein
LASPFLGRVGSFGLELGAYKVWVWHFGGGVVLVAFGEVFKALTRKEYVNDDLFAFLSTGVRIDVGGGMAFRGRSAVNISIISNAGFIFNAVGRTL